MVEDGSTLMSLPTLIKYYANANSLLSGEEPSTITFSSASLLLTSSMKSTAQLVLNLRPLANVTA
jgi:hypothetical protein